MSHTTNEKARIASFEALVEQYTDKLKYLSSDIAELRDIKYQNERLIDRYKFHGVELSDSEASDADSESYSAIVTQWTQNQGSVKPEISLGVCLGGREQSVSASHPWAYPSEWNKARSGAMTFGMAFAVRGERGELFHIPMDISDLGLTLYRRLLKKGWSDERVRASASEWMERPMLQMLDHQ